MKTTNEKLKKWATSWGDTILAVARIAMLCVGLAFVAGILWQSVRAGWRAARVLFSGLE